MSWTQQDTSFKKLQSKRITTSTGKGINEEKGASTLELYLPDIKTEIIPGTPPGVSTAILSYTGGTGQTLAVDTSVPGNLTWFATSGFANTTVANDGTESSENARLMSWISDKYDAFGTVSGAGYEIKVYDRNSNLITKTDPSDWLFDYQTGILTFNNASTAYGTVSTSGPYRIVGYRYIGSKGIISASYGGLGYTTYTKGDLLVGAGSTFIKLNVGTNNYILSADSSTPSGLNWVVNSGSGSGVSVINGLSATSQFFAVGSSGTEFNISSFGSTHTFNIPIAGTGSTGLITNLAQTIAGSKTFSSAIIGDLSGTATTSTYAYQSGYAITSGIATTSNYAYQSGYAITSGLATTATYAYQSGYGITSGFATTAGFASTATYSNQSGYAITSGLATTATYAHQSGYGVTAGFATTAEYSYQSGYGITAGFATSAGLATTSTYSYQSGYAVTSGFATTASNVNVVLAATNTSHRVLFTPTSGSASGVAVSTENSFVYNPSTGVVSMSGLAVTALTASTNTSTGALVVSGGVGIGGTVYTATDLNVGNSTTGRLYFSQATLGSAGTTVIPSMAFIGTTNSPITLSVLADNSLSFDGSSGQLFSINNNLSTGWIFAVNDISGLPLIRANADGTVAMGEFAGNIGIGISNPSYKLHVVGDTNLSSGYVYRINGTSVLSAASLGTGVTNSSLTAVGTITTGTWAGSTITGLYGGTGYTNYTAGDILVGAGGTFIKLNSGSTNYVLSSSSIFPGGIGWTHVTAVGIGTSPPSNEHNADLWWNATDGSLNVYYSDGDTDQWVEIAGGSGIDLSQPVHITSTVASTSTSSGALVVDGGVGIGQSISVGGRLQMFNSSNYTAFVSSASGNTVYTLPATSPATGSSVLQSTSAGVMSWVPMVASASSGATSANVSIVAAGASNLVHSILFTPSSLSAGSAISSDSTITFNPLTEILNVSGLAVTSGTASTNTTTGALVVRGGLGVTGQLSFATASFGFTGIATNPTMSFIGATSSSPITLTVLTDNSLNWEGSQGSVFSIDSNLSTGEIFSVSDISGLPIISASAGQTVNINEFGGFTQIGNGSLNSSSTTTGSLRVVGGLGVTGNVAIGGTFIRSSWDVGEVIATRVYNNTDLGMSATTTINSTTYTNVATITYTPKSTTSHLWIEFDANYILNSGSAADDFFSRITVAGSAIVEKNQIFINATAGGTRSGVIFPISGRYTNTTTSGIAITVQAKWGTSDDAISVYGNSTSGYMRIQEISR